MANSGPEWSKLVSRYNSGTYNNQYMVLDGKLFKPGNALQKNTLYVIEQIPGLVVGGDATNELEKGYWSSYNGKYTELHVNFIQMYFKFLMFHINIYTISLCCLLLYDILFSHSYSAIS